ncbi:hypothetical protein CRU99_13910, partial [Malaciobacter mytili]
IQSYILIGYFLFDRWFILNNYENYITKYSIAFSFSQIVFIALNTIAFTMQKKLGENFKKYTKSEVNNLLKINFYFFLFITLISIFIIYLVIYFEFFPLYGNFLYSFIIISICYGVYYTFSSYNVIALYSGYSKKLLKVLIISIFFSIIISYILVILHFDYYFFIIKSGLILIFTALYTYKYILKCLK